MSAGRRERGDDGATAGRTSGHAAGHLVGDVQRLGLLSAATVVGRYAELVDRATAGDPVLSAGPPPGEPDARWMADSAARMAEAGLRLLDGAAALVGSGPATGRAAAGPEVLVLPGAVPGSSAEVAVWVHNPTASAAADVGLHATSLTSCGGAGIPADAVSFSPARLGSLGPGTSREATVRVAVPAGQAPGTYLGVVLSSVPAAEPVLLSLAVLDAEGAGRDRDR